MNPRVSLRTSPSSTPDSSAQEALVAAFLSSPTFQDKDHFRHWMYRSIRWRALDAFRTRAVRSRLLQANVELLRPSDADSTIRGETIAERLRRAIDTLPERQKRVAELSLLANDDNHAIAKALGIDESAVRSHLRHAKAKLVRSLEED